MRRRVRQKESDTISDSLGLAASPVNGARPGCSTAAAVASSKSASLAQTTATGQARLQHVSCADEEVTGEGGREGRGGETGGRGGGGARVINRPSEDDVVLSGGGGGSDDATPGYLTAIYIVLPIVIVALVVLVVYQLVRCRRTNHRLNWFERSLIEAEASVPSTECNEAEPGLLQSPLIRDFADNFYDDEYEYSRRESNGEQGGCGCVVPGGGGGYSVLPGAVFRSPYGSATPCSFQPVTKITYVTVRTRSVESKDSRTNSPIGEPQQQQQQLAPVVARPWVTEAPLHRTTVDGLPRRTGLLRGVREENASSPLTADRVLSYGGCSDARASPLVLASAAEAPGGGGGVEERAGSLTSGGNSWTSYLRGISLAGVFHTWAELLPGVRLDESAVKASSIQQEGDPKGIVGAGGGVRKGGGVIRAAIEQQLNLAMGTTHSNASLDNPKNPDVRQSGKIPEKAPTSGPRKPSVQFDTTATTAETSKRGSVSSSTTCVEPQYRRQSESSVSSGGLDGRSIGCTGIGGGIANVLGWGGGGTGGSSSGSNSTKTVSAVADQDSIEDQFWVPPTILQKKRAQSLIPQLFEGKNGSSLYRSSPSSSDSIHELSIALPVERLTESATLVQLPGGGQVQRRRRASMQDALDHTKIDASLYETALHCDRLQSFDFPSIQEENLGSVNFSLSYDLEQTLLTVRLIQARDLVARDFSGTADPFCRLCLLPNRKSQLQSRVHKKTLNPEFEEEFIFDVPATELSSRTLEILMFDYDQFSHDECVGQIQFPLEQFNSTEKGNYWKGLSTYEKKTEEECYGDLMFSLAYLPSAERLTVAIIKARKLRMLNDGTSAPIDPFVRVSLVADGKRRKRKKTSTKRNTVNPIWNEALVFNVDKDLLKTVHVEFLVFNDSLLGNNDPLGEVLVGRDTSGDELAHWTDVLHLKNAMPRWHHIQPPSQ